MEGDHMRWTYEIASGAIYLYLDESTLPDHQVEVVGGLILDVGPDGSPVGIECFALPSPSEFRGLESLGVTVEARALLERLFHTAIEASRLSPRLADGAPTTLPDLELPAELSRNLEPA